VILVDTSIWIDFFSGQSRELVEFLQSPGMLCHPMIVGELACGMLPDRAFALRRLKNLKQSEVIDDETLLMFIEQHNLYGRGIGYVDTHLLASAMLGDSRWLWTRDRRLHAAAEDMGVAFQLPH
jgi:predicted nucleic acid-binding protein